MMLRKVTRFLFVCLLTLSHGSGRVVIYPDDPYSGELSQADYEPVAEPYTNLTMDQLISQAYGGQEVYMSDYFMSPDGNLVAEMDMRLDREQFQALYGDEISGAARKKRKATRPLRYRWTNNLVPYEFVSSHFSANEVYTIKQALQEWSDATCLTFRPATSADRNRIRFQNGAGCNSALGMAGGTQVINLQTPGCRYKGLYLHEVGHALGLVHEHQLPDRDEYIYILSNNVAPGMRIWFNKYSSREVNQYGVPYEYSSVMHYGVTAFSRDGRSQTIRAKDRSKEAEIGRVYLKGLSFSDIKVVNLMYQCNRHCEANPSCTHPGFLDKNCQCVCPKNVACNNGGGGGGTTGAPTTGTTAPQCTNTWPGNQCDQWAARGECNNNPTWMRVNCQRSCNTCPTAPPTTTTTPGTTTYMPSPPPSSSSAPTTTTTTTTTPATTTTTARTTSPGETTPSGTTPTTTYMPSPPPSSTTTAGPCTNQWGDYRCNSWSRTGECTANPEWMRANCARACNACNGGGGTGNHCQDRHQYCGYWSARYCSSSPFMRTHCRRSCRFCS